MGVLSNGCCTLPVSPPPLQVICVPNAHSLCDCHGDRSVTVRPPLSSSSSSSSSSSTSSSTDLEGEEEEDDDDDEGFSEMMESVRVVLQSLGEDVRRDGLLKTPLRVARAFHFATKGYRQVAKNIVGDALFAEEGVDPRLGYGGGFGGMVVVRNIDMYSLCGGCLLPFKVCCHIAYISAGYQVVGLSKLPRVADMYARRIQDPQTLADEICQALYDTIKPLGVAVVLQSQHLPVPGLLHQVASNSKKALFLPSVVTISGKGRFEARESDAWIEFLAMLALDGIIVKGEADHAECKGLKKKFFCPCIPVHSLTADLDEECTLRTSNMNNTVHGVGNGSKKANILHAKGSNIKAKNEQGSFYDCTLLPVLAKPCEKVPTMVAAVEAMLDSLFLGGPKREGLHLTAKCFVGWLCNFKRKEPEITESTNGINGTFKSSNTRATLPQSGCSSEIVEEATECKHSTMADLVVPLRNGCSLEMSKEGPIQSSNALAKQDIPSTNGFTLEMVKEPIQSRNLLSVELDVAFCSLCEHHLLPFFGKAHVGYLSGELKSGSISPSSIWEVVKAQSHKLQVQERLTKEIAESLIHRYCLQSIIVVLEASHICMVSRGVEKLGSSTVTIAIFGTFATEVSAKADFLNQIASHNNSSRNSKRTW